MIRLLRSYVFWTYERGSFHYDVMVTLILLFLFIGPHWINFKDKPVINVPIHSSEVLVREAGSSGNIARFVYEIRIEDLANTSTDADLRESILRVIQPIGGNVTLQNYERVFDANGRVVAYKATVLR